MSDRAEQGGFELPIGVDVVVGIIDAVRATAMDTATLRPGTAALFWRYERLTLPVAIVGGTKDRVVDFDTQSRWLHRLLPHSRLHAIEADGHMAHHTEPALLADIVAQAVREAERQDARAASMAPAV